MTFARTYYEHFTMAQNLELCLRLVVAFVVGGLIGLERSNRFKEAGVRTHIMVCCTTALIMLISKYGFADLGPADTMEYFGSKGADTARIAAQAVSGISFLCAGVIIKVGGNIKGLTTAAGIWITAAIGLAVGSGMLVVGLFTAIVVCVLQILMHKFIFGPDAYATNQLHFTVKNGYDFNHALNLQLEAWNGTVLESAFSRNQEDGTTDYDLTVRRRKEISYTEMKEFIAQHEEIISATNSSAKK